MNKFKSDQRDVTLDTFKQIFDLCYEIPGDIQQLFSSIWNLTNAHDIVSKELISEALQQIFTQELKAYETVLNIISGQQLKVLTGIARLGGVGVLSGTFLKQSGIAQSSTIQTAIKRLINLKILFYTEQQYRFTNPFFRAWLLHRKL